MQTSECTCRTCNSYAVMSANPGSPRLHGGSRHIIAFSLGVKFTDEENIRSVFCADGFVRSCGGEAKEVFFAVGG